MSGSTDAGSARDGLVPFRGVNELFFRLHWARCAVVGRVTSGMWAWICIAAAYDEPRRPATTGDRAAR